MLLLVLLLPLAGYGVAEGEPDQAGIDVSVSAVS